MNFNVILQDESVVEKEIYHQKLEDVIKSKLSAPKVEYIFAGEDIPEEEAIVLDVEDSKVADLQCTSSDWQTHQIIRDEWRIEGETVVNFLLRGSRNELTLEGVNAGGEDLSAKADFQYTENLVELLRHRNNQLKGVLDLFPESNG